MSYISKTLTDDEKIIIITRDHWIFWFKPGICLTILLIFWGNMSWNYSFFSYSSIAIFIIFLCGVFFTFLKYISTENAATNKRVIFKTGFIRTNTDELRHEKIENIQIKQSLIGRILNYGNLEFRGTGGSPVIFKTIPNPMSIKKEIENIMYKA